MDRRDGGRTSDRDASLTTDHIGEEKPIETVFCFATHATIFLIYYSGFRSLEIAMDNIHILRLLMPLCPITYVAAEDAEESDETGLLKMRRRSKGNLSCRKH